MARDRTLTPYHFCKIFAEHTEHFAPRTQRTTTTPQSWVVLKRSLLVELAPA